MGCYSSQPVIYTTNFDRPKIINSNRIEEIEYLTENYLKYKEKIELEIILKLLKDDDFFKDHKGRYILINNGMVYYQSFETVEDSFVVDIFDSIIYKIPEN